jgi:hypothetical protein
VLPYSCDLNVEIRTIASNHQYFNLDHDNAIIVMTTDEGAKNPTGKFDTTSIIIFFSAVDFHTPERWGRSEECLTGTLRFRLYFLNLCLDNFFDVGWCLQFAPSPFSSLLSCLSCTLQSGLPIAHEQMRQQISQRLAVYSKTCKCLGMEAVSTLRAERAR